MSRIRTVKPEFFKHEGLFEGEKETGLPLRVAFIALWTVADREGRFRWRPRALKLDCLPYDDVDFSRVLDALSTRGFLVEYEVDGERYGSIPSFSRHQFINNREAPSSFPAPNENNMLTCGSRVEHASSTPLVQDQGEGKGKEGERKECQPLRDCISQNDDPAPVVTNNEAQLFRRGKEVLGNNSGSLIAKLLKAKGGSLPQARAAIEVASEKQDSREYIGAIIRGSPAAKANTDGGGGPPIYSW